MDSGCDQLPGQPVETVQEANPRFSVALLNVPRPAATQLVQRELFGDLFNGQVGATTGPAATAFAILAFVVGQYQETGVL